MEALIHYKEMPTGGSDRKLKKAIKPVVNPLEKVLKLRPVTWRWKQKDDTSLKHGFIAQEVEKVIPHLVSEDVWEDGTKRKFLSADGLVPYLVGAVHEQQRQIEMLKKQLEEKKNKK